LSLGQELLHHLGESKVSIGGGHELRDDDALRGVEGNPRIAADEHHQAVAAKAGSKADAGQLEVLTRLTQPDHSDVDVAALERTHGDEGAWELGIERDQAILFAEHGKGLLRTCVVGLELGIRDPVPAVPAGRVVRTRDADQPVCATSFPLESVDAAMLAVWMAKPLGRGASLQEPLPAQRRNVAAGKFASRDASFFTPPRLGEQQCPWHKGLVRHRCSSHADSGE
jgi:hypothetical protein